MPTGLRWFVKRRRLLVQLTAAMVCLYVVLDTVLTLKLSTKPSAPIRRDDSPDTNIVVSVNQMPQSHDNVNLMLSLNVKGIMRFLDVHTDIVDARAMTSDPPPPDIDIVQHDPRRCEKAPVATWLICVHSNAKDGNRRELLRMTWASDNMFERHDTRVVFFVGLAQDDAVRKRVKKELGLFGDVVQGNFTDDSYSGPIRARLMLKWVRTYCQKAKFILKVSDDSLVDIIRLMALVSQKRSMLRVLACPLIPPHRRRVERDPRKCRSKNKFCANYTEFPGMTHFPQHCAGVGYVLSQQLVAHMYKAVNSTPGFWLEEIYMTAMLTAKIAQIQYIDLADSYTTDANRAVKDTTVLGQRKYFISRPRLSDFSVIWKWMLGVLEQSELKLLSRKYAANRQELSRRLIAINNTTVVAVGKTTKVTKKPSR